MSNQDHPLRIDVTANGYIVQAAGGINCDRPTFIGAWHVFETFDAMIEHLRRELPIYPADDKPKRR